MAGTMPRRNSNAQARPRRRTPPSVAGSKPETLFDAALKAQGYDRYEREYRFHHTRRWKFDFAWPDLRFAIEIEGGIFVKGRHVSPRGFIADCEKYNNAVVDGWEVLRLPVHGKNNAWIEEGLELVEAWMARDTE